MNAIDHHIFVLTLKPGQGITCLHKMIFDKLYVFWVILLLILDLTILALKLPQLQGQNIELGILSLNI